VAHETRITVLQEKTQSQEQRLEKMDAKLDRILERLPNK
jgi:hypothetical protein